MKKTAIGAALTGALALSALAVPAANADDSLVKPGPERFASSSPAVSARSVTPLEVVGDTKITNVTVHGNKSIDMGTTNVRTITVSVTATDPSGIADAYVDLWHGSDLDHIDGLLMTNEYWDEKPATCTAIDATTSTCKLTITIDPRVDLDNPDIDNNLLAGTWHVTGAAVANDGDYVWNDYYKTAQVKRYSRLTNNASPEPVYKGKTITVTGFLSRASWEYPWTYKGYGGKTVTLQYKRYGSAYSWTNVKNVTTASTGDVKTTTTATYDGYYRFVFAGNSGSTPITPSSDFVDVK